MKRVNCKYATDFCQCRKRKKTWGIFSKGCIVADGSICDLQKKHLRPDPPMSGSGVPPKKPMKVEVMIREDK